MLRTSIVALLTAASEALTSVGAATAGSARAWIATGSVYMKPVDGAATISHVCTFGSYM